MFRINGKLYELDEAPKLDKQKKHTIDVVVDRFKVRADHADNSIAARCNSNRSRLVPSHLIHLCYWF
ncbi:hypothetical protein Q6245_29110, partial [Klebsiella pneumoniae]|uniref:hypothetical protein n=1 Tax=Klebsiella pneumoniae TaxID=573 RepID=UPI00272F93C3